MTIPTAASLTLKEVAALLAVRNGQQPAANSYTASLINKGFLTQDGDTLGLTQHGDDHVNLLPNYGEALIDILIPGPAQPKLPRDVPGNDRAPASNQTKP